MKTKTNTTAKRFSAILSLVLAILFVAVTAVQAFHNHANTSAKHNSEDTEYVYANEKCSVCDYVVHKQSHYAYLHYPPVLVVPVTKAVTLLSKTYAGVYKFTLQGFTNKGPPVVA